VAVFGVLPHCRKGVRIENLFPLPWDGKPKVSPAAAMTKEECQRRAEVLLA
jgi:hypothetical protein